MVISHCGFAREDRMAKKRQLDVERRRARYEFRVWGEHRKARKKLARLASEETTERVKDCYLIVDDHSWNAKVRDNTLKVKQLVAEDKGFEQWSRNNHHSSTTAPSPFDEVFDELRLDRPQRGKSYDLEKAVANLDPDSGVRAVFVTKDRRRYRIGNMRAEVTDISVHETGEVLRTLSFEGDSLEELVALRKELGVKNEPNLAVHQAIENEVSD
jgi:hypothetical protein